MVAVEYQPVDWALAYARAGFAVLPVWWRVDSGAGWTCACAKGAECDRPAKHPIPRRGVTDATRDPDRIRSWWAEHPEANIALATGSGSGVIVIDVDTGDGKEGDVSITTVCAERGGVPRTLKARSGSGGIHYWYKFRQNPFTRKIGFLRHVDYLSDGGYVIVQPSVNLKGGYKWDADAGVTGPEDVGKLRNELAQLPEWFDALEGTGRAGRKRRAAADRATDDIRARRVSIASMDFKPGKPAWVDEIRKALTFCDPDSRDDWVLFGMILGREFQRSDDGWMLYAEWAARSAKFEDPGTEKAMRGYFYKESLEVPQNGRQATIATILARAAEGGYVVPINGLDQRQVITYRAGRAMETAEELLTMLARERESDADRNDGLRVYSFGNGLGSIVERHDISARYTPEGRPPNGWVLEVLAHTPMSIGSRITHTATIVKHSPTGSTAVIECPAEVSTLVLSKYSKHFPRLSGIVQWPMVMGGRVVGVEEEYEPQAGVVFALPEGLDLSGLSGTETEAHAAWEWLQRVALEGFPLQTERDRAGALALLLTFVQRRAIDAAPAFLITAPKVGTGKTSLVRFASRAVHGRSIGAGPFSGENEEQRKAITAALLTNPPAVLFDNLAAGSSFNSNELAIAMTSADWEDRKLGSTERLKLPNRAVWCFTGNNISLKSDLRRRFVVIRMVSDRVAHHEQLFTRNIDVWPTEHRTEVLRALISILLWGARSDVKLKSESGFQQWDAEVRRVVYALTGVDPFRSLAEQSGEEEEDEEEEAIAAVMMSWAALCGEERRTVAEWVERVHDAAKSSDAARRRMAEAVEGAVAVLRGKPVSRVEPMDWGYAIKLLQDRTVSLEGCSLVFVRDGMRHKVSVWKLVGGLQLAARFDEQF